MIDIEQLKRERAMLLDFFSLPLPTWGLTAPRGKQYRKRMARDGGKTETIRSMIIEGVKPKIIARDLGCSIQRVYNVRHKIK